MEHMTPLGQSTHSGTYTGHLIPVMGANASMDQIRKPEFYEHIYSLADRLYGGMDKIFSSTSLDIKYQGLGARFGFYFNTNREVIKQYRDCAENDTEMNLKFYSLMLERDVYFHDYGGRPCHHGFSIQHQLEDMDEVLNRIEDTVKEMEKMY